MTQSVISQKDLLRYGSPHVDILSSHGEKWWVTKTVTYHSTITEEVWLVVILTINQIIVTLYCVKVVIAILVITIYP